MMAEKPNYWWSLYGKPPPSPSPPPPPPPPPSSVEISPSPPQLPLHTPSSSLFVPQYLFGSSPLLPPNNPLAIQDHSQDFPLSWSHLLQGGLACDEEEILNSSSLRMTGHIGVKQELEQTRQMMYVVGSTRDDGEEDDNEDEGSQACSSSWSSSKMNPVASTGSHVPNSISSNILNFSTSPRISKRNQLTEQPPECNGTSSSGTSKKARIQPSSTQAPLKVRKEKLGERITALHQLVSPFGKTDTASVLQEAAGYIRFLEGQIEALSSPYLNMGTVTGSTRPQHFFLSDTYLQTSEACKEDVEDQPKDLRSRGLCLVPVACTDHILDITGSNNGADYWAPALGGAF